MIQVCGRLGLEAHQTTLHEELDRAVGQNDSRRRHARFHLHIDEEEIVQIVLIFHVGIFCQQVCNKSVSLLRPNGIHDFLQRAQPRVFVVAGLESGAQLRGFGTRQHRLDKRDHLGHGAAEFAQVFGTRRHRFPRFEEPVFGQIENWKQVGIDRVHIVQHVIRKQ